MSDWVDELEDLWSEYKWSAKEYGVYEAREDIHRLIAEVRRLRGNVATLRETLVDASSATEIGAENVYYNYCSVCGGVGGDLYLSVPIEHRANCYVGQALAVCDKDGAA